MEEPIGLDSQILLDLVKQKMPFGKYKDRILADIPVSYLEWMQKKGMPKGKLGMQLSTLYEIKLNGLQSILDELKRQ